MGKAIWRLILFLLPLGFVLIGCNIYVDPAGRVHDSLNKDFALSLLNGNDTFVVSGNLDERKSIMYRIDNMKEPYDVIAVGPSLVMCITSEMVESDSFMNFGESGAQYYDIMAIFGQLDKNGLLPNHVLFCIDTMLFDGKRTPVDNRWNDQKESADYMLSRLGISQSVNYSHTSLLASMRHSLSKYLALCRISYFQSSVKILEKQGSFHFQRYGIVNENYTGAYWRKDGSHVYSLDFRQTPVNDVKNNIFEYINNNFNGHISLSAHIEAEYKKGFESLIGYLYNCGVEVTFFLCPFPPPLWDEISSNPDIWSLPLEVQEYANAFAKENGIHVIGSLNPYECGVDIADYYDNRHLKAESIAAHFNFSIDKDNITIAN